MLLQWCLMPCAEWSLLHRSGCLDAVLAGSCISKDHLRKRMCHLRMRPQACKAVADICNAGDGARRESAGVADAVASSLPLSVVDGNYAIHLVACREVPVKVC